MTQADAIEIVKLRRPDCSKAEINDAWQFLVDNGTVWSLGRWYSDMASCLLASGTLERNAA